MELRGQRAFCWIALSPVPPGHKAWEQCHLPQKPPSLGFQLGPKPSSLCVDPLLCWQWRLMPAPSSGDVGAPLRSPWAPGIACKLDRLLSLLLQRGNQQGGRIESVCLGHCLPQRAYVSIEMHSLYVWWGAIEKSCAYLRLEAALQSGDTSMGRIAFNWAHFS